MTTMPSWLVRHLDATGMLEADGAHRTAARGRCRRCHAALLIGLDSDPMGFSVRVDPWLINQLSEFAAIATGRATYNLVRTATGTGKPCWNIDRRYPEHISGAEEWLVVAEHRCQVPLPADDRIPAVIITKRTETDEPSF